MSLQSCFGTSTRGRHQRLTTPIRAPESLTRWKRHEIVHEANMEALLSGDIEAAFVGLVDRFETASQGSSQRRTEYRARFGQVHKSLLAGNVAATPPPDDGDGHRICASSSTRGTRSSSGLRYAYSCLRQLGPLGGEHRVCLDSKGCWCQYTCWWHLERAPSISGHHSSIWVSNSMSIAPVDGFIDPGHLHEEGGPMSYQPP